MKLFLARSTDEKGNKTERYIASNCLSLIDRKDMGDAISQVTNDLLVVEGKHWQSK